SSSARTSDVSLQSVTTGCHTSIIVFSPASAFPRCFTPSKAAVNPRTNASRSTVVNAFIVMDICKKAVPNNGPDAPPTLDMSVTATSFKTAPTVSRSEEHTSELQSRFDLVCRLLLEKKKSTYNISYDSYPNNQ